MRHRTEPGYLAFVGHRLSGIVLAAFLPFHFLLLSQAIRGAEALEPWIALSDNLAVKVAEWGLVSLLVLHFIFGMRILMIEFGSQEVPVNLRLKWIVPGAALALAVGAVFFALAIGTKP